LHNEGGGGGGGGGGGRWLSVSQHANKIQIDDKIITNLCKYLRVSHPNQQINRQTLE